MSNVIKPIKASNTYRKLKEEFREYLSESRHNPSIIFDVVADKLLIQVALDTTLNVPQREQLVELYKQLKGI